MRVKKLHQDPRRVTQRLDFAIYQEIEQAVKMHMETYVKKKFPDLGPRKPFAIWKQLKDEEELIRSSIVQQHSKVEEELKTQRNQEKAMTRAKSKDAIKVRCMQHWRTVKDKEIRRNKHRMIEQQETRASSAHERKARAKEEYRLWLQRKVTQSKETALNQRKERLMQQQAKAAQELKAVERAENSYQQWIARKQFESAQKEQQQSNPMRIREMQQGRKSGPVLMAYSANRKGLSKELMTELSGFGEKDQSWSSSNRSGAKVRRQPLFEDVLESDLGSSDHLQPVHLLPRAADQSDSMEDYEDDYEDEDEEANASQGLDRKPQKELEYSGEYEPQRGVKFQERRGMKWGDEEGSSLYSDEDEHPDDSPDSHGSYHSDDI